MTTKAVFLDRDGTIARDAHYCRRREDFDILPTVPEAVSLLNREGFKVVVVTNQSGIARGYFDKEALGQIHQKMEQELAGGGARIDAIYYCPHHPEEDCGCRKPKTGLFQKAASELGIDLKRSYVVGDMPMDIDAGRALGCQTVLVTTGPNNGQNVTRPADYTADSLLEASEWITGQSPPLIATSIIVPAYNEGQGLPIVLNNIFAVIDDNCEVIVVDDGSTDNTTEVAAEFPCRVIKHKINQGKGEALKTGLAHARGDSIIWIDADNSYPAELIPRMVQALNSFDMAVCSRKYGRENIPRFNRIGNFIFRQMIKRIYGFKPYDPCTGLYGAKKRHLEAMKLTSRRFAIEPEISIKGSRMKLKMLEFPIEYQTRVGDTKLNAIRVGFEDLITILKLVFWQPSRRRHG